MKTNGYSFNRHELAGALGDLGVFLPLAIALITLNGINAVSVFLAAGLLYIGAGFYFGIPMPVQPLKATAVIAISMAATPQMLAATAIGMSVICLLLSCFDVNNTLRKLFPRSIIRGIQLSLSLVLIRKGFNLFLDPRFLSNGSEVTVNLFGMIIPLGIIIGLLSVGLLFALKGNKYFPATLAVIIMGVLSGYIVNESAPFNFLPLNLEIPKLSIPPLNNFYIALPILLLPQLPLTFANSIMATEDTSQQYFGSKAKKVHPRALLISLGLANLLIGLISGIPVCHGSGGLTAHYHFGGRTGGTSIIIGSIFVFFALIFGSAATDFLNMLPLAILGIMLVYIGISHSFLIKDIISIPRELSLALGMACITLISGNMVLAFATGVPAAHLGNWLTNWRVNHVSN